MTWAVVRVWLAAHRAGAASVAIGSLTAAGLVFGALRIPDFQAGHTLPLWCLYPGALALVAVTTSEDGLDALSDGSVPSQRVARLLWALGVWVVAVAGTLAVQTAVHERGVWLVTAGLVAVVFGVQWVTPLLAWSVAVAAEVSAVLFSRHADAAGLVSDLTGDNAVRRVVVLGALVVVCGVSYAWAGPRRRRR